MPEGNHNMSDSACRERAQQVQTIDLLAKQIETQQQQIKLLFKFVRELQKETTNA